MSGHTTCGRIWWTPDGGQCRDTTGLRPGLRQTCCGCRRGLGQRHGIASFPSGLPFMRGEQLLRALAAFDRKRLEKRRK